ncbi:MAG: AsmA family protein [Panacagrimonas sp.]
MMTRSRWRLGLAAVLVVLLIVLLLWDWNWFKGPVESRVEAQTGRSFSIGGDLDVALGWKPRIRMERVRLGNPSWARTPEMFTTESAEFTLDLRELLAGRLLLPSVTLVAPKIDLEKAPGNENNWQLASQGPEQEESEPGKGLPRIGTLRVDRGELVFYDPVENTDIKVQIATKSVNKAEALVVEASGRFRTLDLDADATGGKLLSLTDLDSPYPIDGRFRIGKTRGTVNGTITGVQAFREARLQLAISGETLADLTRLTAVVLPDTPPYRIAGLLVHEGDRWVLDDFSGKVGDSDLAGDVTVSYVANRPNLVAKLVSKQLDLDDLAGFVGAAPQAGSGETASAEQQKEVVKENASARVLPDKPVNLASLRSMDADVRFTGQSLRNKKLPIDDMTVHLMLDKGVLRLDPLNFGVAGGDITSNLSIDARDEKLAMDTRIEFKRLDLAKLLPGNSFVQNGAGLIGGRAQLSGTGSSTAALLASADGELGIAMRDGKFSNLLIEGIGLDAAEALRFLVSGDRTVNLRCAVIDLQAKDGVLTPRSMVIDTTDTNLHVDGSLSLADETLDLTIHPLPKDFSPLSLRSPLHVRGTFKDPSIRLDKALLLKGGVAVVLATLVTPLAALLPLIERGPGENEDCGALVASVKRRTLAKSPS